MNKFLKFLNLTKDWILEQIFPSKAKCLFCETDVPDFDNMPFCEHCLESNILNEGTRCKFCDVPILDGNQVCDFCASKHKHFTKATCPFVYQTQVRRAILKLKEDHALYLVSDLAKIMVKRISEENFKFDYIIPVPVHEKTKKRRGYNQAELLAKEISALTGKPMLSDLVIKYRMTKSQKFLSYEERQRNLKDSFSLTDKNFVKDKSFLIVDDVITTCATVNIVAMLLKKSKAKEIYVTAIARNPLKKKK